MLGANNGGERQKPRQKHRNIKIYIVIPAKAGIQGRSTARRHLPLTLALSPKGRGDLGGATAHWFSVVPAGVK